MTENYFINVKIILKYLKEEIKFIYLKNSTKTIKEYKINTALYINWSVAKRLNWEDK